VEGGHPDTFLGCHPHATEVRAALIELGQEVGLTVIVGKIDLWAMRSYIIKPITMEIATAKGTLAASATLSTPTSGQNSTTASLNTLAKGAKNAAARASGPIAAHASRPATACR
jgi:hypothetical protein